MNDQRQPAATQHDEPAASTTTDFERLAALVHAFIGMMQAGGIARMDIEHADLRLSLRAHGAQGTSAHTVAQPDGVAAVTATTSPQSAVGDTTHIIRAPMIGTFYVASAPNEPPLVQVGEVVEEGQTIGIIEAMKIMNEIAADRSGTVVEIVAANAQTVEYGSPLILLAVTESD